MVQWLTIWHHRGRHSQLIFQRPRGLTLNKHPSRSKVASIWGWLFVFSSEKRWDVSSDDKCSKGVSWEQSVGWFQGKILNQNLSEWRVPRNKQTLLSATIPNRKMFLWLWSEWFKFMKNHMEIPFTPQNDLYQWGEERWKAYCWHSSDGGMNLIPYTQSEQSQNLVSELCALCKHWTKICKHWTKIWIILEHSIQIMNPSWNGARVLTFQSFLQIFFFPRRGLDLSSPKHSFPEDTNHAWPNWARWWLGYFLLPKKGRFEQLPQNHEASLKKMENVWLVSTSLQTASKTRLWFRSLGDNSTDPGPLHWTCCCFKECWDRKRSKLGH